MENDLLENKLVYAYAWFLCGIVLVLSGIMELILSFVARSDLLGLGASLVLTIGALFVFFSLKWTETCQKSHLDFAQESMDSAKYWEGIENV